MRPFLANSYVKVIWDVCLPAAYDLTDARLIWFFFAVELLKGPGKIYEYFKKILLKLKSKLRVDFSLSPLFFKCP